MSFTTIYRAMVMVAAGVIVVKGWQLYGPTAEQLKSAGLRTIELASSAWNQVQPAPQNAAATDPRLAAPGPPAAATAGTIEPAPLLSPAPAEADNVSEDDSKLAAAAPRDSIATDDLSPLYSRLKELGVSDPQLAPWGSSGEMYRFCCRAALADTPAFTRHFEAVAAEPVGAVEQVVAMVEAWRATQRDRAELR